jgi:ABC-2 type transport system permease protein
MKEESLIATEPAVVASGLAKALGNTHAVDDAERGLMHGTATAGQVAWVLITSAALVAVFAPLTMSLYRKRQ